MEKNWPPLLPLQGVVTPMCISLNLGRTWPDEVYVDGVYHHTRPSRILYMKVCMYTYSIWLYLFYMLLS